MSMRNGHHRPMTNERDDGDERETRQRSCSRSPRCFLAEGHDSGCDVAPPREIPKTDYGPRKPTPPRPAGELAAVLAAVGGSYVDDVGRELVIREIRPRDRLGRDIVGVVVDRRCDPGKASHYACDAQAFDAIWRPKP